MNGLLYAGCTLAGGIAGMALSEVAARLPANRTVPPTPAPATGGGPSGRLPAPAESARDRADQRATTPGPPSADPAGAGPPPEPVAAPDAEPVADLPPGPVAEPPSALVRVASGVVTGILFLAAAIHFGATPALAPYCVLFCGLVALSVTDLRAGLVPRRFLYPWAALVAVGLLGASAADDNWHDLWMAALCGVIVFAFFFVVWYLVPRGMGFGDVRLAGVIGLALGWLGPLHVYLGFLAAFVLGALYGLVAMVVTHAGRRARFPFAPALSAGAVVAVLWGGPVITAWLGHGT